MTGFRDLIAAATQPHPPVALDDPRWHTDRAALDAEFLVHHKVRKQIEAIAPETLALLDTAAELIRMLVVHAPLELCDNEECSDPLCPRMGAEWLVEYAALVEKAKHADWGPKA